MRECLKQGFMIRLPADTISHNLLSSQGFVVKFVTLHAVYPCEAFPHPIHTVSGMPNCIIRLSTAHFTTASVRWVARPRAQRRPPNNCLNRNMVSSAMLCRVYPLSTRHGERPWTAICSRTPLRVARHPV